MTQSQIDHHWPMQTAGISSDTQHFERHVYVSESFDMVSWTNPNRTTTSFCRTLTPKDCRPLDVSPCRKSIYYLLLISSAILALLNHKCEYSFASVERKKKLQIFWQKVANRRNFLKMCATYSYKQAWFDWMK